jgi:hypothetical protein
MYEWRLVCFVGLNLLLCSAVKPAPDCCIAKIFAALLVHFYPLSAGVISPRTLAALPASANRQHAAAKASESLLTAMLRLLLPDVASHRKISFVPA